MTEHTTFPEPAYAENIVVGVIFRQIFAWYVTDKAYWYLDYTRYENALLARGWSKLISRDYAHRFGVAILNEDTAEHFCRKSRIAACQPVRCQK